MPMNSVWLITCQCLLPPGQPVSYMYKLYVYVGILCVCVCMSMYTYLINSTIYFLCYTCADSANVCLFLVCLLHSAINNISVPSQSQAAWAVRSLFQARHSSVS